MKQTVNESAFRDAFRAIRPDNFSYAGLGELYEWFEQLDEDTGQETELDVIAICCDFSEYDLEDLSREYGYLLSDDDKPESVDDWADILNEHTIVIPVHYRNSFSPDMDVDNLIVGAF